MDLESLDGIKFGLQDCRREGLTQFFREFMQVLLSQGFTIEDMLYALSSWADEQPRLEDVVGYLEKATDKMAEVQMIR